MNTEDQNDIAPYRSETKMSKLETIFDKLYNIKALKMFSPAIKAFDYLLRGPGSVTGSAPHIVDNLDIKRYMSIVIIALIPSTIASVYFYGLRAIMIILVSYIFGGITEVLFAAIRKKEVHEGFLVTGLIFPLVLPPTIPLWVVAVGVVFGVVFGKEVFGGTGRNIFNPALVGRIFITIAFPVFLTTSWQMPFMSGLGGFVHYQVDAITSVTPLVSLKLGSQIPFSYMDLLLGRAPGSLGETFRLGIIISGLFLMLTKVANWRIPVSYIGSVFIISGIGNLFIPGQIASPGFQLLSGGLLFGAFFMATDPVSSPFTKSGKWIYGILLGLLTVVIRSFTGYVEGVMFSIILANAIAPLIDSLILRRKYKPIKKNNGVIRNER